MHVAGGGLPVRKLTAGEKLVRAMAERRAAAQSEVRRVIVPAAAHHHQVEVLEIVEGRPGAVRVAGFHGGIP